MKIETWDPHSVSEAELRDRYEFLVEFDKENDPETPVEPFELWQRELLEISPFHESQRWTAFDGDRVVGTAWLGLNRTEDNRHLCRFNINVTQSARRRGVGTALLWQVADAAEADRRTTLLTSAVRDAPAEGFLQARGFEAKLLDRRSRLHVDQVDRALVAQWVADAEQKSGGYSLLLFDGPIPDEYVEAVVDLEATMNDAPRDELDMDDWHLTVEELRDAERRGLARGLRWLYLAARHDETGELAGFTYLDWHPLLPELVWQGGTAVRRAHRGHGLGRWLKASNFNNLLSANPDAKFVDTWNAGSNQWMLAINDDLGFKPYIWYPAYQGRVDDVRAAR